MCGGLPEMKKLICLLALLSSSLMAQSVSFTCNGSAEDYALELIAEEFAGKRTAQETKCLEQKNFKYIRALHDPINEVTRMKVLDVVPSSLKVLSVEVMDKKVNSYRVNFSVTASERGRSSPQVEHKDSLIFMIDNDKKWGCAQLLSSPEALLNRPGCY